MKRFAVVSPPYVAQPSQWEPPEPACDYFEVEAETERDAVAFAVRYWLSRPSGGDGEYARELRADGRSPYGARYEVIDLEAEEARAAAAGCA